jgi:hypothetical protein
MARTNRKARAVRRARMIAHYDWAKRRWDNAFDDDWDYEYLLRALRVKLVTMSHYFNNLSYIRRGRYYGGQMSLAIKLIDIILDKGGQGDFKVNMHNRSRIPSPDYHGEHFWCEEQRLRFDKAWTLLWRLLSEKMMSWSD